jgi:hypothetical protein
MRWKVEIADFVGDPRMLREVLEPLSIGLQEAEGKLFIAGHRFETDITAAAVRENALRISAMIEGIGAGDPEIRLRLSVGDVVVERSPDGSQRRHHFATLSSVATLTATCGAVVVHTTLSEEERKRLEEEQREREFQRVKRKAVARLISAELNPRAIEVQRILAGELTPHTMWHIVELIEADGVIHNLGISQNKLGRLTRSINHPDVYGKDARHSVRERQPPPKPMELDEARAFVRDLADRWFEYIAGI